MQDRSARLAPALERRRTAVQSDLTKITKRYDALTLAPQIARRSVDLAKLMQRFKQAAEVAHSQRIRKLDALDRLRLTLGYTATLDRGFAVVRSTQGEVLTTQKAAKSHAALDIEFADGTLSIGTGRAAKQPKSTAPKDDQGTLF